MTKFISKTIDLVSKLLMNKLFTTLKKTGPNIVVILTLTLCGCLKNEDETLILPAYVESVPESIIPKAILDSLGVYMNIHSGPNPPVIEGGYLASPMALRYASDAYANNNFYLLHLLFSSQSCRNTVSYCEEQHTAQMVCDDAQVVGDGKQFTFAGQSKMVNKTAGWSCKLGLVISGEMATDGSIHNLEYANVMLEKEDPYNVLIEVGTFRVYRDQDATTGTLTWQPRAMSNPSTTNIMR